MTPAIKLAEKQNVKHKIHQYQHDANASSFGDEAVAMLGVDAAYVFKTLVVDIDEKSLVVAVIPVQQSLSLKLIAKAFGGKKAAMADKQKVQRTTGYVLGGVSPLGQKKRLPTFIDASAQSLVTMFVSAGKRGLEIELAPKDLLQLSHAQFANLTA